MRKLESGALSGLSKVLGIGGGLAGAETMFDDESLQQVLDVAPYLRRSLSNLGTQGIFLQMISNTHDAAGASTVTGTITPYKNPGGVAAGPWPKEVPETQDVWLLGVRAETLSGPANFTAGRLTLQFPAGSGYNVALVPASTGVTGSAAVATAGGLTIRGYTQEVALGALGTELAGPDGENIGQLVIPFRIPRNAQLIWSTVTTALGASVYQCRMILGLFPAGYGQDFSPGAI